MSRLIPMQEPTGTTVRRHALLGVLASLFALIGGGKARAADALTIGPNGTKITGSMKIDGSNTLEFGADVSGKQGDAGKIGYQAFTKDAKDAKNAKDFTGALDIVGAGPAAGPAANSRKIKFWAEGGATFAGDVVVAGTVTGKGAVPPGAILMWSGDVTKLPASWHLCDGSNGTPDLRGRFVVGQSDATEYAKVGATGGRTHFRLPNHAHGIAPGANIEFNFNVFGADRKSQRMNASEGTLGVIGSPEYDAPVDIRPPYFVLAFIMYRGG